MAARYRKIDPRMWDDEKFRALTPTEKLVANYVITAQSNRCGLFVYSGALAQEHLNLDHDSYAIAFNKVLHSLNWRYDSASRVLYIPTWWKYNSPENPKHLKGCLCDIHSLPANPYIKAFYTNEKHLTDWGKTILRDSYTHSYVGVEFPNHRYQEQEQEQEQEQDSPHSCSGEKSTSASGASSAARKTSAGATAGAAKTPRKEAACDQAEPEGFLEFWNAWPKHFRKKGRQKCAKVWERRNLTPLTEKIIASVEEHKNSANWKRDGGQFIPLPLSWLNDEGWDASVEEESEDGYDSPGFVRAPVTPEVLRAALGRNGSGA